MRFLFTGLWNGHGSATFTSMMHFAPRQVMRILVVAVLCLWTSIPVEARIGHRMSNLGIMYGPAFRGPLVMTGQAWELSYDRLISNCRRCGLYWGAGIGTELSGYDGARALSVRVSISPYRRAISRRLSAMTLMSVRAGRFTGNGSTTDFIRPVIGLQLMSYYAMVAPKLILQYGRDLPLRSSLEGNAHPVPGGVFTVQAGVTVNIGSLARRWRKSAVAPSG